MSKRRSLIAAACAFAALSAADAGAQSTDAWKWQGSLYLYLPDVGGKTTFPQGAGSNVALDADTILSNLKFTFMGSLEASRGQWGLFTDVVYVDLGNSKSGFRDFTIGNAALPAGASANASLDLKALAWTLGGTWRLDAGPASTLDLLAGARLLDLKQTLKLEVTGDIGSIVLPGRRVDADVSLNNWDAIVGLKGRTALGEERRWFIPYYADVGTGESKVTWQAMAGIGYAFRWGDVVAAWRYVDYEMKSGKKVENLTFNGPAVAAVFHW